MPAKTFREEHSFDDRKREASQIRAKYKDRIPVIAQADRRSKLPSIDKKKYLVPPDLTVQQFQYVIRKRVKLAHEEAIFIYAETTLPNGKLDQILLPTSTTASVLYSQYAADDGFLYLIYSTDNVFGGSN